MEGMDFYKVHYRDSVSDYKQAGDVLVHYKMVPKGNKPETNYKYFISCDWIGFISANEMMDRQMDYRDLAREKFGISRID